MAAEYPLRRLHEHVPGLQAQRGPELWRATYSGPIGVIIDPTFNLRKCSALPFASTLNGSCTSVCPVRINIHEQIYKWRQVISERNQLPLIKKEAMQIMGKLMSKPKLYRAAVEAAGGMEHLPRSMMYSRLNPWGLQRKCRRFRRSRFASGIEESREERGQG